MSSKIILALFMNTFIFIFVIRPNVMALDDTSSLQCDGGIVVPGDSADSVRKKAIWDNM